MSCRFLPKETGDHTDPQGRLLRHLEVTFHNGVKAVIPVSAWPSSEHDHFWHYEVSADGKRIRLHNQAGASSVQVLGFEGEETAHETVDDWPLVE